MLFEIMNKISDFISTPKTDARNTYEFSIWLEDKLVDDYDKLYKENPEVTYRLSQEVPDICATAEPGMSVDKILDFKNAISKEINKVEPFLYKESQK